MNLREKTGRLMTGAKVGAPMRFTKRVAGEGHVTVPATVRDVLGIDAGDVVEFEVVGVVRRVAARPADGPAPSATSTPT